MRLKRTALLVSFILISFFVTKNFALSKALENFFKINIDVDNNWLEVDSAKTNQAFFQHKNKIATINIKAYYFTSEVPTANGLQQVRMASYYDGWINMFERFGTEYEVKKANVDESYIAVYGKDTIESDLSLKKLIVAEYYYIKEDKAYIIGFHTEQNSWKQIQTSIKYLLDSFWIGNGKRPAVKIDKTLNTWSMAGNNAANQNFIKSRPNFSKIWKNVWEFKLGSDANLENGFTMPVFDDQALFFSIKESLFSLNKKTGDVNWNYKLSDDIKKNLIISDDILYLISNSQPPNLYAILARNGSILFRIKLLDRHISNPILKSNKILLVQGNTLYALDKDSGETCWFLDRNFDFEKTPVSSGNIVVSLTKENEMVACEVDTGRVLWQNHADQPIMFQPSILRGFLIVTMKNPAGIGGGSIISVLDLEIGSRIWQSDNEFNNMNITTEAVVGPLGIYINYYSAESNQVVIAAYDIFTGEVQWSQVIESKNEEGFIRPVVSSELLVTETRISTGNALAGLDLLTGAKVVMPIVSAINNDEFPEKDSSKIRNIRLSKDKIILVLTDKKGMRVLCQR